jgi:hypothetical protein
MQKLPPNLSPEAWIADIFGSKAAREGRVVRRSLRDIDRYVGRDRFVTEIHRRGFRAVENAGQMVVFCNRDPVRIVRGPVSACGNGPEKPAFPGRNCWQFR